VLPRFYIAKLRQTAAKRIVVCCGFVGLSFLAIVGFGLLQRTQASENILPQRQVPAAPTKIQPKLVASYGKLPLSFEAKGGQTGARVRFLARGGYRVFLTDHEADLSLRRSPPGMNCSGKLGLTRRHEPFGPVGPRAGRWPSLAKGWKSPSLIPDLSQLVPDSNAGKGALWFDCSSPCPTRKTPSGPTGQSPRALRVRL
jgi:hypothetical protein